MYTKKNNTVHLNFYSLSSLLQDGTLGDKETAVRIRGNSHYRIFVARQSSRNAYRSVHIKVSWAIGEMR